jgi:hypothetical protein
MDRWKAVEVEIEDFRRYLAPNFPPIKITEGYDFRWSQDEYKRSRKERPYQCCGVYLFYDDAGTLLYVGKAIYTFDKRIWTHQIDGPRYIDLICFDERHAPFALALEHFLICRLKPKGNTQGIGYEVPKAADTML